MPQAAEASSTASFQALIHWVCWAAVQRTKVWALVGAGAKEVRAARERINQLSRELPILYMLLLVIHQVDTNSTQLKNSK